MGLVAPGRASHQKRVVEFGEWLCQEVIKAVPHRHFIFSIQKFLRRYFLYDRKLLSELSRCAWESLKVFLQETVPEEDPGPGAVIAIQRFGDFLAFNPHCHILVTDGCFYGSGMFRVAPSFETKDLGKTCPPPALNASQREAGGSSSIRSSKCCYPREKLLKTSSTCCCPGAIQGSVFFVGQESFLEKKRPWRTYARYIIRTSFSQERMTYISEQSKDIYQSKDGKEQKAFDTSEWPALLNNRYVTLTLSSLSIITPNNLLRFNSSI